jgi:group I intron endonuclease
MAKGLIYKATNKINGKSYVGQTIHSMEKRMGEHLSGASNGSISYFHKSIRKYGKENFKWEVLCECNDIDELNEMEKYYIKENNSFDGGYNLTTGGEGYIMSEITKQKMSESRMGRIVSDETKKKISESSKGRKAWNAGKTGVYSQETLDKFSKSKTGKNHYAYGKHLPKEHRENISKGCRGKKVSKETREKLSKALKGKYTGENSSFYEKTHSDELKKRWSDMKKGNKISDEQKQKISNSLKEYWKNKKLQEAK